MPDIFSPIPADEILKEEFLKPMGITACRLAKDADLSATCVGEILSGNRTSFKSQTNFERGSIILKKADPNRRPFLPGCHTVSDVPVFQ